MALAWPGKWLIRGFKSLYAGIRTRAPLDLSGDSPARRRSCSSRQASARLPSPRPDEARNFRLEKSGIDGWSFMRELGSTQFRNRPTAIVDDRVRTPLRIGPL